MLLIKVLDLFFNIYFAILIVYIFSTWIPNVNWKSIPWKYLQLIAVIYLGIFEAIFPTVGSVIGIIVFKFIHNYIIQILHAVFF